ncbi:hypothetical protein OIU84_013812 [Salix udensis]|uniref:Uncharacterized protein n=1 Tax=Salix udensis TaxID=889485 RepID=A0AAD6JKX1_9ROSI|nr:hypothetical protein OIU84_013812 [Salix udensis]
MASGWVKSLQKPTKAQTNQNQQKLKPELVSTTPSLSRSTRNSDLVFPALAELPEGHPSRDYPSHELEQQTISGSDRDAFQSENGSRTVTRFEEYRENIKRVVEIILHTSWSNKSFPGRIEMLFKVKTGPRTVTRFEENRENVKIQPGVTGCDHVGVLIMRVGLQSKSALIR